MKLLSLNLWGGTCNEILFDFLKRQSETVDIFCFQEVLNSPESLALTQSRGVRVHLFMELALLLPDFQGFFAQSLSGHDFVGAVDFELAEGLAIFIRKTFQASGHKHTHISGQLIKSGQFNAILEQLSVSGGRVADFGLYNFHGLSLPGDKQDSPERLLQSAKIKKIVDAALGPKILCGDFNLHPKTQSIRMLEGKMRNLIKDFNITDTRNNISRASHLNDPQYFADYIFVSPEIRVKSFEVPYNEVSDHLPMVLEFSL